jgi:1,4-alpha-glucan branching enzyme
VYSAYPDVQTIAEESTAWKGVTRPPEAGGLGFGYKWDLGWMHDTLGYLAHEPIHRKWHHDALTFRVMYHNTENYVLPLSHDEVVHGKRSLIGKLPGDLWQQCATLRLLFGYQWSLPGKKLMFMGGELGVWKEWNHDGQLDWAIGDHPAHAGVARWVGDLNRVYRSHRALHVRDCDPVGFEWLNADDHDASVITYLRTGDADDPPVLVIANFTPVPREGYRIGVPRGGHWRELLNSDAAIYGGSGIGNRGGMDAEPVACRGHDHSLVVTAPPLAIVLMIAE